MRRPRKAGRAALHALVGIAAALALVKAEADAAEPESAVAQPAARLRTLHIVDGAVPSDERLVAVREGDRVHLQVISDRAGEMHLHAYRLSVALVPDATADLDFLAFATGRFRLEWHPDDARGRRGDLHAAGPLATLEVRPR